jgi:hypothetical protein
VYHSALSGEIEVARLRASLHTSTSIEEARRSAAAFRSTRADLPGYRLLLERFGTPGDS